MIELRASELADQAANVATKGTYTASGATMLAGLTLKDVQGFLSCIAILVAIIVPIATFYVNYRFRLRKERLEAARAAHEGIVIAPRGKDDDDE
ncbi:MAG: hypothetical protein H6R18_2469 [Proteobacteria bacterium]|nr:hypothetical protein [Pseudomonadota bacterium]